MTANKAEITSIVTYIAKEAEKRNGSQKKAVNQQLIIEKTITHLLDTPDIMKLDQYNLRLTATVIYCIYSELCAYKQYQTFSEGMWYNIVDETVKRLREDLSDDELFMLYRTPQMTIDRLQAVFVRAKEESWPKCIRIQMTDCELKMREKYKNKPTLEVETIIEKASRKFMLSYDPYADDAVDVNIAYYKIFSEEETNYYNSAEKKNAPESIDEVIFSGDDEIELGEMIVDKEAVSPEENAIIRSQVLRECIVMRDIFIVSERLKISKTKMTYYRCFYTDSISAMIEVNKDAFDYVRKSIRSFSNSNGISIDFLNYFVDAECRVITDAVHKPRKLISIFKPDRDPDERCKQPLELIVIGSYLNKSVASVSVKRNEYFALLKTKFKEVAPEVDEYR